jgi:hypothetical protein
MYNIHYTTVTLLYWIFFCLELSKFFQMPSFCSDYECNGAVNTWLPPCKEHFLLMAYISLRNVGASVLKNKGCERKSIVFWVSHCCCVNFNKYTADTFWIALVIFWKSNKGLFMTTLWHVIRLPVFHHTTWHCKITVCHVLSLPILLHRVTGCYILQGDLQTHSHCRIYMDLLLSISTRDFV